MQVMQSIYNEITGKSEKLEKAYDRPFQVTLAELEQLNSKIVQLCEQYSIEQSNCHVVIYHDKGAKETFSSFERFRTYNQSKLDPVERIRLKYSFLIILPKLRKPQSYELTVQLVSGITAFQGMRDSFPAEMLVVIRQGTAHVSVEYVDYLVARNVMDTVGEWLDGVPHDPGSKITKFLQKRSRRIPELSEGIAVSFITIALFIVMPVFVSRSSPDFHVMARFVIASIFCSYVIFHGAQVLGRWISGWIVGIDQIGYIKLNKGDEKAISDTKRANRLKYIKASIAVLVALITGVVSSLLANVLSRG